MLTHFLAISPAPANCASPFFLYLLHFHSICLNNHSIARKTSRPKYKIHNLLIEKLGGGGNIPAKLANLNL